MNKVGALFDISKKTYDLARPYGRKKLVMIGGMSCLQAVMQVIGVTSIFPFLALASDPERLRNSQLGSRLLNILPPMDNGALLLWAGIGAIFILFFTNATNLFTELYRTRYAYDYGHWLRMKLMANIMQQPYSYFLNNNSGVFIKKLANDTGTFTQCVLLPLLDATARILIIFVLLATVFYVNARIAIVSVALFGGFYLMAYLFLAKFRVRISDSLKDVSRGMSVQMLHLFNGIKPIKISLSQDYFMNRISIYSKKNAELLPWINAHTSIPRYLVEPLAFGGLVIIVLLLNRSQGNIVDMIPTLGVMALAGYRLMPAMQLLYGQLTSMSTMSHALEEIYDELKAVAAIEEDQKEHHLGFSKNKVNPWDWTQSVVFNHVSFQYHNTSKPVLNDINIEIKRNSAVAIIGETGAGKSTLIDLLIGLYYPTHGQILIDGETLTNLNMPQWRRSIGYVPQEIFLIDDTIMRNIAFGVDDELIDSGRVREVCAIAQIADFIEKSLPSAYDTIVGERGTRLSGGQRQRIGLARALYHHPRLLVLDEATSALDEETEKLLVKALESLRGHITMVIVAHRLSTIKTCEVIYRIQNGIISN